MANDIRGMHFLVTGGSGYLGQNLVGELLLRGSFVTLLTSSEVALSHHRLRKVKWNLYFKDHELEDLKFDNNFPDPIVLIHLAHSWTNALDEEGRYINLIGTLNLHKWAQERNIKFIFASSVSAREGALNQYGKAKFLIEKSLDLTNTVIARIGLVYGGKKLSQWGLLCKLVGRTRILPMVDPWVRVQPIPLEKVIEGLICIAIQDRLPRKIYTLATNNDISFGDFLKLISEQAFHRTLLIVPISSKLIFYILDLVPQIIINTAAIKDRILGLIGITKINNIEELNELNLAIGDIKIFEDIELIQEKITNEAILVMTSIANKCPSASSIEKYVLAIKQFHDGAPYRLPFWVITPFLLRLIEPLPSANMKNTKAGELLDRFNLALGILESGESANQIYNYTSGNSNIVFIVFILIIEAVLLPVRWAYWRFA
jgi:nucleoside-diphosphate-sugar epimerase